METKPHAEEDAHPANGHSREITPGVPLGGDSRDTPARAESAIDLAAWGRGEREYLFDEVQKAIDERIWVEINALIDKIVDERVRRVHDRRSAVEYLVDEGIIDEDEARDDV